MAPNSYSKQDSSAPASRPIKKVKQKQAQQLNHTKHNHNTAQQTFNSHSYNHPIVLDEDQSPFPPPPPPPPRKDKHKKQHQKENKKKRTRDETEGSELRKTAGSSGAARSIPAGGPEADADINEDDDEEADSTLRRVDQINNDDEADDETDLSKHQKKKVKKNAAIATASSATNSTVKNNKTNRLVLRLPRSKGFGPSTKPVTKTSVNTSPVRNGVRHPSTLSRTVTSSPQSSSSELSEVDLEDLPEDAIPELGGYEASHNSVHFAGYESESSDGYSDLLDDDEDDLLEAEEAYLIADKLHRQGRHSRRGTTSPGAKRSSDGAHSDAESLDAIHGGHNTHHPIDAESVLFEIAQLRDGTTTSEADADSAREIAVTWSGAEEDDILDDLDEFLGITTDDSAALRAMQNDPSAVDNLADDGKTMRFEDFLGQDDGTDSGDSDSTEEESSSDDEEHSVAATGTDAADREDDEELETTKDVVKEGGFVFFKASHDDDETESECDLPEAFEDDGGDTTDTLDDTDHLGMIRFGIEAAESDDEDAEEVLANAIRDRNLIDAHNMGLSVSIEALAEQPEAVVLKTARSLGISTETAAKILTSVGMSILMRSNGHDRDVFAEPRPSSSSGKDSGAATANGHMAGGSRAAPVASTSAAVASPFMSAMSKDQGGPPKTISKTFEPVLGDFAPSGEADLCVVVGATDVPAPSPFSARKRKTRSSTRSLAHPSPNGRGQSVASTMSSQSAASAHRYQSSEEPQYNFILDLDDLVDPSMLPSGMTSVSEEDEDLDDAASVSTALGGTPAGNAGVGDVSRWNRIPIGAFRSQNPTEFTSIATAVFSGTRDPTVSHDLSFHDGVSFANGTNRSRNSRYIPVSPVLFPVGQTFKALAAVKSRKEHRKDKKPREGGRPRKVKLEHGQSTSSRSRPSSSSRRSSNGKDNLLRLPSSHQNSLPSDGLTHHVSPLFSGVGSGMSIPPLSLS